MRTLAVRVPAPSQVTCFGAFKVKLRSAELYKNGVKVKLQRQPFEILAILLESPGEVITREELRQRLWPADTFVDFEQSLNTAIMRLRQALEDSADNPHFIETLPRHGYRFIAPVDCAQAATEPQIQGPNSDRQARSPACDASSQVRRDPESAGTMTAPGRRARRVLIPVFGIVAMIALLVGFNVGGWRDRLIGHARPARIESLAVLPLDSLSSDPEQEYFAEGMTEQLITELGKLSGLRVISRGSVMQYSGKHAPLADVARQLRVDAVLEGSVARSGDKLRITVNLFEVATRQHLWAETYERNLGNTLSLQRDIARDIADKIQFKLLPRDRARLPSAPPGAP